MSAARLEITLSCPTSRRPSTSSPLSCGPSSEIGRNPTQAGKCCRGRLVLAANPPAVIHRLQPPKNKWIVDLTGARLVPSGNVGNLDMGDSLQVAFDRGGEVPLHDLHVIRVVQKYKLSSPAWSK